MHFARRAGMCLAMTIFVSFPSPRACAQGQSPDTSPTVRQLAQENAAFRTELEAMKKRLSELEVALAQTKSATASETSPSHGPQPQEQGGVPGAPHHDEIPGLSGLQFRAFTTAEFEASDAKGDKGSFRPAQLDLVMTDALSPNLRALAEVNFEANDKFETSVDIERLQLSYTPSEYFGMAFGRFHSDLSYFNTAFHHGRWLETLTDRPLIVEFPDSGGLLPMHKTGLEINGQLPGVAALGLHYFAEFGANPDFGSNTNAVAAGIYAKPDAWRGFRTGFSFQHARLTPAPLATRINESIYGAHLVFRNSRWEFLNEAFLIRHEVPSLSRTFRSPGFYSLVSSGLHNWRPFFLYQYVNVADDEPMFGSIGRENGPSFGVRYDVFERAALKLQYFRDYHRHVDPTDKISIHMDWVF